MVTPWLSRPFGRAGPRTPPSTVPSMIAQHLRADDQEQGRGEALQEQLRHRAVEEEGVAEIEPRELGHVGEQLLVERAIQAVVAPDLLH